MSRPKGEKNGNGNHNTVCNYNGNVRRHDDIRSKNGNHGNKGRKKNPQT